MGLLSCGSMSSGVPLGSLQILAAINVVHTSARDIRDTDWSRVIALYDQLVRLDPSPVVSLNRAIAIDDPCRGAQGSGSRLLRPPTQRIAVSEVDDA